MFFAFQLIIYLLDICEISKKKNCVVIINKQNVSQQALIIQNQLFQLRVTQNGVFFIWYTSLL